jgi:MYXO-CTERM domain-containing protein
VEAWANWYDTAGPNSALINVEGTCQPMTLERGTAQNGAYRADITGVGTGCHRYYFVFEDSGNQTVTFPTTGSLGIGPAGSCEDWNTDRPALGAGCSCTADCAGKNCGDDGCGGSCGTCSGTEQCVNGNCEPLPADGSVPVDGAPGADGTTGSDGTIGGDGTVSADGSTSDGDGGGTRFTGALGGCDCATAPTRNAGLWLLLLAVVSLLLLVRIRRF